MPSQFVLDTGVLDTDLLGPVVIASASANLGGITPSATSLVTHLVTMSAPLGTVSATARAADTIEATANAPLGSFDATANSRPESAIVASTGGGINFVQPNFPQVVPPQQIEISTIIAGANASLGSIGSQAMAEITFSILEDDAEVLLLI